MKDEDWKPVKVALDNEGMLGFNEHNQLIACWRQDYGSIASTSVADLRDKICPLCQQPFALDAKVYRDAHFIHELVEFAHGVCYVGHIGLSEFEMWYRHLLKANFLDWEVKKIPNEYRGAYNTPWYRVEFSWCVAKMKLGCRKRVWHLEIYDLTEDQVKEMGTYLLSEKTTTWASGTRAGLHVDIGDEDALIRNMARFALILGAKDHEARRNQPSVSAASADAVKS